jgi:hypothetical protein
VVDRDGKSSDDKTHDRKEKQRNGSLCKESAALMPQAFGRIASLDFR